MRSTNLGVSRSRKAIRSFRSLTIELAGTVLDSHNNRRAEMRDQMFGMLWNDEGQDIAEYAVMLAVILVIVVGTIRLVGSNANTVFSQAASAIQ